MCGGDARVGVRGDVLAGARFDVRVGVRSEFCFAGLDTGRFRSFSGPGAFSTPAGIPKAWSAHFALSVKKGQVCAETKMSGPRLLRGSRSQGQRGTMPKPRLLWKGFEFRVCGIVSGG